MPSKALHHGAPATAAPRTQGIRAPRGVWNNEVTDYEARRRGTQTVEAAQAAERGDHVVRCARAARLVDCEQRTGPQNSTQCMQAIADGAVGVVRGPAALRRHSRVDTRDRSKRSLQSLVVSRAEDSDEPVVVVGAPGEAAVIQRAQVEDLTPKNRRGDLKLAPPLLDA